MLKAGFPYLDGRVDLSNGGRFTDVSRGAVRALHLVAALDEHDGELRIRVRQVGATNADTTEVEVQLDNQLRVIGVTRLES